MLFLNHIFYDLKGKNKFYAMYEADCLSSFNL